MLIRIINSNKKYHSIMIVKLKIRGKSLVRSVKHIYLFIFKESTKNNKVSLVSCPKGKKVILVAIVLASYKPQVS